MGLHNALVRDVLWGYWWYYAYNRQRGRQHLFCTPFVKQKYIFFSQSDRDWYGPTRIEEIINEARITPRLTIPAYMTNEHAQAEMRRVCNREQQAVEWDANTNALTLASPAITRPRGVCETCFNRCQEMGTHGMLPTTGNVAQGIGLQARTTMEQFIHVGTGLLANDEFREDRYIQL